MREAPGIAVACAAAVLFGLTAALQHAAAGRVDRRPVLDPRLLTQLIRSRLWLVGGACDAAASALQAWAARLLPVTLAQPVLVLGLPFAVVFRNAFARRWPRRREIVGCLVCASAVALFVVLTQPQGIARVPGGRGLEVLAAALAGTAALGLSARRASRPALVAGVAGGVALGIAAVLLRAVVGSWHGHPDARWYLAALLLLLAGSLGLLTTQSAFQYGPLPAPLAALTLVEPAVATVGGTAVLGEHLRLGGPRLPLALAAVVIGVVAVVDLARGQQLRQSGGDPDDHRCHLMRGRRCACRRRQPSRSGPSIGRQGS